MLLMLSVVEPGLLRVTALAAAVSSSGTVFQFNEVGEAVTPVTVKVITVFALRSPDVPAIVTGEVPMLALPAAERVRVLVLVVGFGLKPAVTPTGRPEAFRVTLPAKPFCGMTVIVLVPLPP